MTTKKSTPKTKKPKSKKAIKSKAKRKKRSAKKTTKSVRSKKDGVLTNDDSGLVVIEDDFTIDKEAELEERKAYLDEARSQEAFD